jgi:hypothetical protein
MFSLATLRMSPEPMPPTPTPAMLSFSLGGLTDANGGFSARAFFGRHRLSAQLPDGRTGTKEVHWERGGANRFDLSVS